MKTLRAWRGGGGYSRRPRYRVTAVVQGGVARGLMCDCFLQGKPLPGKKRVPTLPFERMMTSCDIVVLLFAGGSKDAFLSAGHILS